MIEEIWKDITYDGYEGLYQASNLGRIRVCEKVITYSDGRVYNYPAKIVNLFENKSRGYLYVNMRDNNHVKRVFSVHRIVADTFIPNPDNLPQVNHKDENKLNNRVDNLEWCTQQYNCTYGTLPERQRAYGKAHYSGKSNPMYGRHHTESTRQKMREAHKHRAPVSDETRRRQSVSQSLRWQKIRGEV